MKHWRWLLMVVVALLNYGVWTEVWGRSGTTLSVSFLDVGQGDAILIQAPNGNQMLIDGGPDKKVLARLGEVLPFSDRSLDLIMATHPDADHIGGLPDVFDRYEVSGFMEPGATTSSATYRTLKEKITQESAPTIVARRGMRIVLDEGVFFDVLFPDVEVAGWVTNEASIIGRLTYGQTSFLLTGDNVKTVENYLTALNAESLDVDVLKAGHHGSKTSSAFAFLAAASPSYTVISVGKHNTYGHPHPDVLKTLTYATTTVLRTDYLGTITFRSDGQRLWRE